MATEQTQNVSTNDDSRTPVSFDDVTLETLEKNFNDTYKVSKGSASQVVLGFKSMANRLQDPQNEYQQELYPHLKQMCMDVYDKYCQTFLTQFESDAERQVYGANLNGNRNTGSLYRSIPSGVNRNLTYNYAQFGQLLRVLSGRLRFVVNRDADSVQRYKESHDEFVAYQHLQKVSTEFLQYLENVSSQWDTFVKDTRTKYSVEERPQRTERSQHQERSERPRRTYYTQRNERTNQTERPQRQQRPQRSNQTEQKQNYKSVNYKPVRTSTQSEDGWNEVPRRKRDNKQ
jgi:hypothetical protein